MDALEFLLRGQTDLIFSFEDLLRRQAIIINSNDAHHQRSYCQLNGTQKTVFLARLRIDFIKSKIS